MGEGIRQYETAETSLARKESPASQPWPATSRLCFRPVRRRQWQHHRAYYPYVSYFSLLGCKSKVGSARRAARHSSICANLHAWMKLVDKFVSRELLVSVLFAIAVLSLVLVVGNIFRKLLPLLVNHDVPVAYLLAFIAYVLPFSLIFTIPWGLLTAILLVFGRLSADNELTALRSNGVSISRICIPLGFIAMVCTAVCLWLNVAVAPTAQEKLRSTIFDLATRNPMALFGSDQVIDEFPGRKIYVGKKDGNKLENITVFELDRRAMPIRVTYARSGLLEADLPNKRILMHLYRSEER